jgi:hypothetical protein
MIGHTVFTLTNAATCTTSTGSATAASPKIAPDCVELTPLQLESCSLSSTTPLINNDITPVTLVTLPYNHYHSSFSSSSVSSSGAYAGVLRIRAILPSTIAPMDHDDNAGFIRNYFTGHVLTNGMRFTLPTSSVMKRCVMAVHTSEVAYQSSHSDKIAHLERTSTLHPITTLLPPSTNNNNPNNTNRSNPDHSGCYTNLSATSTFPWWLDLTIITL